MTDRQTDRETEKERGADVEEVSDGVGGVSQSCVQLDAGSALYSQLVALLKHLLLHRLLAGCRRLQQLSISTTTTTRHPANSATAVYVQRVWNAAARVITATRNFDSGLSDAVHCGDSFRSHGVIVRR